MDKLAERTLQSAERTLQSAEIATRIDSQNERIDKLTSLVEKISMAVAEPPRTNTINVITQVNAVLNIKSFDSEEKICIPVSLVKDAFTENSRLIEYCQMTDEERTNADKAAPYVLEALVDLVRRAHRDPLYQNVHLNPKRSDQALVCIGKGGREQHWEVRQLIDVVRVLFDGVADNLHRLITTDRERTQLPFEVQSAASWVPNLYEEEPERFVKDGRAPIAAHLANNAIEPAPDENLLG